MEKGGRRNQRRRQNESRVQSDMITGFEVGRGLWAEECRQSLESKIEKLDSPLEPAEGMKLC